MSLTEAVMVLSSQLERSGHVSRQAVRRRVARDLQMEDPIEQPDPSETELDQTVVLKMDSQAMRKAG